MNTANGTTPANPLWMAFVPRKVTAKELFIAVTVAFGPILMAYIMTKPALKQSIQMRTFHYSKCACQKTSDFFQVMANRSAQEFNKAKL